MNKNRKKNKECDTQVKITQITLVIALLQLANIILELVTQIIQLFN